MEKHEWNKIVKRLLENSLFLLEAFDKDNSLMFFLLLCVKVKAKEKLRKWFGLVEN